MLAASPIIPCVGSLGVGVMSVSAAYEATAKVMKVDFQNMEAKAVNIQKTTGTISDEKWVVDASNNGKLQSRGSDAQFNNGTKITIPVSGKGTITVVSYPNYHNYTVGGKEVDKDTYVYEYDVADAKDATVDIVATGTSYLYSIENLKMHISQILNIMQKIIKQELRHMILLTIQLLQLINLLLIRF